MSINRTILAGGVAIAALLSAGAASAQSVPPTQDDQKAKQNEEGIADIVVTAERRSETVQRSSLSIEVLSGAKLADVTRPQDLTEVSPAVQVGTGGPTPQVFIRGVGDPAQNSRSQSAVAFNIDNVYIARTTQVGPLMFDVSRLEILKGPQGTLYGRNASGGAINIITNNPEFGRISGYVGGSVGNLDLQSADAAINLPLSDKLAFRAAGQIIDRSGYTSNGGQDEKVKAARAKLLWEPRAGLSLLLSADVSAVRGQGSGVVAKENGGAPTHFDPWRDITQQPLLYPFLFGPNTAPYTKPDDRFLRGDAQGVSAELNADLGFAKLTVIPAYRHQNQAFSSYTSRFRFYEQLEDDQTTLEARLGNESASLKWVAGLYYFDEDSHLQYSAFNAARRSGTELLLQPSAWAAFAQATYSIVPRLRVIGGLRYTAEQTKGTYQQGDSALPLVNFTSTSPIVTVAPRKFRETNYKVGAEFDVAARSMLYATYATGFKGGGFSLTISCGADDFDPEYVDALTIGSRNRFANDTIQLNIEAFQWKYRNQQTSYVGLDKCGVTTLLTRNVGTATIRGLSTDFTVKPTAVDTLRLAVEYNHSRYDSFSNAQFGIGSYAPAGGSLCAAKPTGGGFFNIDCSGLPLPRTPRWAGTASAEHVFELGNAGEFRLGGDMVFASSRWLSIDYVPNGRDNPYQMYNASLEYRPASGNFSLTAFANNITNTAVYTGGSSIPTLAPNGYGYFAANILPPRTYGVRGRFNF
jgi:iron complex outermembrane recepter protein